MLHILYTGSFQVPPDIKAHLYCNRALQVICEHDGDVVVSLVVIALCELQLIEDFRTSATNCAHIYNTSLSNQRISVAVLAAFPTQLELDTKDI